MNKKYIVRLTDEERQTCTDVIKKLKGTSQKVRRAQILLKADADGPAWIDTRIAEAFNCRIQTIENLRKRLVTESFELSLDGKKRQSPPHAIASRWPRRSEVKPVFKNKLSVCIIHDYSPKEWEFGHGRSKAETSLSMLLPRM